MMDEQQFKEQLSLLKGMTEKFNVIHEAQTLQLEMWPFVLFDDVSACSFKIDFDKKDVNFSLKVKKLMTSKKIEIKKEILTGWVRNVLWDKTNVNLDFKVIEYGKQTKSTRKIRRK